MLKYHPYKSDKPGKNTILSQNAIENFVLGLVALVILQFIKMNNGDKDI